MLTISLTVTSVFYLILSYLAYVTAAILYHGIRYNLVLTILRSSVFIGVSYISIITDVLLFGNLMYSSVFIKNGLLLVLILASLSSTNDRKETEHANKGE